jgi:adenosylcobinamide-phosphate guanylyltransferase
MIAVILAGGKSSRISIEKQLMEVDGKKMINRVVDAVNDSKAEDFIVAVTRNAPKTREYCKSMRYKTIETSGNGYHEDLRELLNFFPEFVSISSDLPFLKGEHIDLMIDAYQGCSITGAIHIDAIPQGVTPSHVFEHDGKSLVALGLNIVTPSEGSSILIFDDPVLGINVNTRRDLEIANGYVFTR